MSSPISASARPHPHVRHYVHHLPFGAQLIGAASGDPQTRFRFWAPSCHAVQVVFEASDGGEGQAAALPALDMTHTANGWFEAQAPCGPGTRYRYRIDGKRNVPDPASRFQPQGVDGPSVVVDPRAHAWQNTQWIGRPWEETVVYELHVGALGGYRNVAARLPALAALGVTAIELMPLNDATSEHSVGYDGVLPYAPHAAWGTPDELKALIDAAHGLGLQAFVDVVYHRIGAGCDAMREHADAFFRADERPDFERPEVRDFFCENALYWLSEYRFDGLRIDAADAIGNEAWLRELSDHVRARIEEGRHVHLVLDDGPNTACLLGTYFDAQWNNAAQRALHALLTGEAGSAGADAPIRELARVLAPRDVAQPPTASVMFLQSHAEVGSRAGGERLRKLCADDDGLRAAAAFHLLAPHVPLLFMGEEHGSTDSFQPSSAPAPSPQADPDASLNDDQRAWLHFYQSALAVRAHLLMPRLRHTSALGATVLTDDADNADSDQTALVAHWRMGDGEVLTLALNLGGAEVPLNHAPDGMIVFETPDRARDRIDAGMLPARACVAWMTGDVPHYALRHDARIVQREEAGA